MSLDAHEAEFYRALTVAVSHALIQREDIGSPTPSTQAEMIMNDVDALFDEYRARMRQRLKK